MNFFLKMHIAPAALFAMILHCSPSAAATLTFNFVDPGWTDMAGITENFTGSFTGTPGATGVIGLNDLTAFTGFFNETNAQNEAKTIVSFGAPGGTTGLTQFLFDTNANTLTLAAANNQGQICLGDAVAQGTCGPLPARPVNRNGVPAPPIQGLFVSLVNGALSGYDTSLPAIQVSPSGIGITPQPAPAMTPEPGTWLLCGAALLIVPLRMRRWKRADDEKRSSAPHPVM